MSGLCVAPSTRSRIGPPITRVGTSLGGFGGLEMGRPASAPGRAAVAVAGVVVALRLEGDAWPQALSTKVHGVSAVKAASSAHARPVVILGATRPQRGSSADQ